MRGSTSLSRLRLDLATARLLIWVASAGRDAEIAPEAHLYLFDRYQELAQCYRQHGRVAKARAMQAKADAHARQGGWDGPPYAAAMGMPRPRRWLRTDAVSRQRIGSDDAA
jgi:hypothetical protein